MPKLANLIGRSGEVRIPVPDDEDFVVKYSRPKVTPEILLRMASMESMTQVTSEALDTIYELASSVIVSWNLEDDDGLIPINPAAIRERVDLMILMDLVRRIAESFKMDPQKGEDSAGG